ncbi:transposase, partial [Sinorhizobium medicae]|uniref:transposase n=1 Tax=Sinorhizobium medicae TaxID=110321 RepID=UPI001F2757ED
PFFAFPEGVRRIIYTTNAIEALNSKLRRAVRSRGHFPGDEAAMKLLYLVLNNAAEQWKRAPRGPPARRRPCRDGTSSAAPAISTPSRPSGAGLSCD